MLSLATYMFLFQGVFVLQSIDQLNLFFEVELIGSAGPTAWSMSHPHMENVASVGACAYRFMTGAL